VQRQTACGDQHRYRHDSRRLRETPFRLAFGSRADRRRCGA
jgi:hypothetical protein